MRALRFLPGAALLVAAAVGASGFGVRFGAWDWRTGFTILRWATYAGLVLAAVAAVLLLVPRLRAGRMAALSVALALSVAAAAVPLYLLQEARRVPAINDITTDPTNPPAFVAILPLRAGAPVPAAYAGPATAKAQHEGYPDIRPVILAKEPRAAFEAVLALARETGWTIVAADAAAGRIEATDTTPWFGFKDDIVIRVTPADTASRIDMRSVSRVGRSDLGVNAHRIRSFLARIVS